METRQKPSGGRALQIICLKYFVKPAAVQTEPVTRRTSLCPQPQAHSANLLRLSPCVAPLSASLCPPVKWAEGARAGSGWAPGHAALPRWPRSPYGTRRCHLLLRGVEKGDGLDSCAEGNFPPAVAARLNILWDGTPAATAGTRGTCQPRGHPAWQLPGTLHQHPVQGPSPLALSPCCPLTPGQKCWGGKGVGESPRGARFAGDGDGEGNTARGKHVLAAPRDPFQGGGWVAAAEPLLPASAPPKPTLGSPRAAAGPPVPPSGSGTGPWRHPRCPAPRVTPGHRAGSWEGGKFGKGPKKLEKC